MFGLERLLLKRFGIQLLKASVQGGSVTKCTVGMQFGFSRSGIRDINAMLFGKVCLSLAPDQFQYLIYADKCENPFKAKENVVSPCLIKHHGMKTYGRVHVELLEFLTLAIYGGEWSATRPSHCNPWESNGIHWIGGTIFIVCIPLRVTI
jgi:hypothetical protein